MLIFSNIPYESSIYASITTVAFCFCLFLIFKHLKEEFKEYECFDFDDFAKAFMFVILSIIVSFLWEVAIMLAIISLPVFGLIYLAKRSAKKELDNEKVVKNILT